MLNPPFANGCCYHIYNRGVEKRIIFNNRWDYSHFLQLLNYYRKFPQPLKFSDFRRGAMELKQIKNKKELITIYAYCLMPNHFHLLLKQENENGITKFLKQITNSYTRYFNTKYDRIGPLVQGTFKAKLIETDEYLLELSKYIHRNPIKLSNWANGMYPYSSYKYYLSKDKHSFCNTSFISSYFSENNPNLSYQGFIEENELDNPGIYNLLIDPDEE